MAGWTRARMRRHLIARNRELGGTLLVNVGRGTERPRWTVTISALQAVSPQWFHDPETIQRELDELREQNEELMWRVTRLERIVEAQTARLAQLPKPAAPPASATKHP